MSPKIMPMEMFERSSPRTALLVREFYPVPNNLERLYRYLRRQPSSMTLSEEFVLITVRRASATDTQPTTAATEAFEDAPPNGGYGWVCTFCGFMITVHTWGINSSWGVIMNHYISNSTFPNANHLDYALIGGLSISASLIIGPLVSKTYKSIGTSITLLLGTVILFASLFSASYATEIWHLYLSQGLCFGIGLGFLYLTAMSVLPQWFSTRRSFAMGLAGCGTGIGGIAYNLGAARAIETMGVESTYRMLALCTLVANTVSSLLLKDRPRNRFQSPERMFNYRELGDFEILLVALWGMTTEFGYITLWYSLPNYASSIGLSPQQGAIAGAILNLGLIIGRPIVGYVSDYLGRITIPMTMTAICGLLCFVFWIPAKSYALLLVFAILVGTVCGTFWSNVTPVMAEIVGLSRLPSTFGLICLTLVVPTTFAEPIALSLVGRSGYLATQVYVACMFMLGALSLWILRSWKFYEIEKKSRTERESDGDLSHNLGFPSYFAWFQPRKLFLSGRV
ncbi:MFS general substrate transporter [Aspergillus avenaceus]|uniref:MFS general substrate transporter n=1 Tax=Aspergillus avenaceus TaxID=36643 RepID=A0A5N6UA43_ASPAV|nr:MFS general substrate transporter [Aspergillus avenaceus]